MSKRRMSFEDACDLVPDDMPDGAYFAMAHEMAGLEYGDGFDELIGMADLCDPEPPRRARKPKKRSLPCDQCHRGFRDTYSLYQHKRDKHGKVTP